MQPPRDFLLFRLWGPMASWGEIAVGERRGSWSRPSRSGVLGLVAAALGIDRNDTPAHQQLEQVLGLAVRVDHPGKPLRDYHTAQSPSQKRGRRWATRRDELNPAADLNTILSERGYYIEMDAVIALWARGASAAYLLTQIEAHLAEPVFTLYLGRKACPLGLPPAARFMAARDLDAAFRAYDIACTEMADKLGNYAPQARRDGTGSLWLGEADAHELGLLTHDRLRQRTQRRDGIRDRARWLFDDRAEVEIAEAGL
jgi:CRISPR system Cascade subunit CasD